MPLLPRLTPAQHRLCALAMETPATRRYEVSLTLLPREDQRGLLATGYVHLAREGQRLVWRLTAAGQAAVRAYQEVLVLTP